MAESGNDAELSAIVSRNPPQGAQRYSWMNPDVYLPTTEGDRVMLELFSHVGLRDLSRLSVLEVGCSAGSNLLRRLPAGVRLIEGDACALAYGAFDITFQSTVFSSILDDAFQAKLANRMWEMTKPGGGVLWHDFCYNNPKNPNLHGVPVRTILKLFPGSKPIVRRVTLAPPICRFATRFSPHFYPVLNALPMLRTHVLCWIPKPHPDHDSFVEKGTSDE